MRVGYAQDLYRQYSSIHVQGLLRQGHVNRVQGLRRQNLIHARIISKQNRSILSRATF